MTTYLLVDLIFISIILLLFRVAFKKPSKKSLLLFLTLIVLTALFDSLLIMFNIVAYDTSKILGLFIINAPIEDFFYVLMAVILVPLLWERLEH